MAQTSRFPGFYKLTIAQRHAAVQEATGLEKKDLEDALAHGGMDAQKRYEACFTPLKEASEQAAHAMDTGHVRGFLEAAKALADAPRRSGCSARSRLG